MISSAVHPFFKTRFIVAALSLVGFWVCMAKVDRPFGAAVVAQGPPSGGDGPAANDDTAGPSSSDSGMGPAPAAGDPAAPLPPLAEPVVMIDPGHGGSDGGMVRNGLLEKDWTLKLGIALAEELRERGHKVALTRDMDSTIPLEERPVLVNAAPRMALLSIHFNAGTPDAGGVETWYSWPKKPEVMARLHNAEGVPVSGVRADDGQRLAQAVQEAVTGRTGARDRGIKNREDLAMTSRTVCPAVLIECGFLSNGAESRKIQDASYRKKLVQGIANGYENWLKERSDPPVGPPLPATGPGHALPAVGGDKEH